MHIEFVGAAQTVTGSKHIVRTKHATLLLDCGLFQGRRHESVTVNQTLGFDAKEIDAVVLSHAHIDHSGGLPFLARNGFEGPIYATPATRDLCAAMLADAAAIQAADARHINKSIDRDGLDMDRVEPLYDERDVVRVLESIVSIPYRRKQTIAPGIELTFFDAGHVLGSAVTVLSIDDAGSHKRLIFTGDLGRPNMPILRDPEIPPGGADILMMESTYGDRLHPPIEAMHEKLAALLRRVFDRKGKVIIPSFALERAQEVVFALKELSRQRQLPPMPIYVDSPLTTKITEVFKLHPECYDDEARAMIMGRDSPFEVSGLKYVTDKDESKSISADDGSAIIVSASGMCEAGRVLHHLRMAIEDEKNAVLIVGFQAEHTLGRRIVERRPRVRIFGVERDLRAEVMVLNGFSAHADQKGLLDFASGVNRAGPVGRIALVHGEPQAQKVLAQELTVRGLPNAMSPRPKDRLEL